MGDLYRIKGIFNKEGYQSYQSSGCCIVGARLLLWQDRAVDPNYLEKKQVASILIERAAHLWEALYEAWTRWKLKILAVLLVSLLALMI